MSTSEEHPAAGAQRVGPDNPAVDDHRPHPDDGVRGPERRHPPTLGGQVADVHTQLVTRSHEKSATDTDYFCESFRFDKAVDNGGLAQMERLLQFGRVLSRSI